jgi:hypothetical protein
MEARKRKVCLLLVLVLVLSVSMNKYSPTNNIDNKVLAKEINYGINDILNKNSDDNQFTIVEIVPHKGLAEIGYSVSGQEPVQWKDYLKTLDTYKKRTDFLNTLLKEYTKVLDPNANGILEPAYTLDYIEKSTIPSTSNPNLWTTVNTFDESISKQTGYFSFENGGDGNYRFSDNLNIDYFEDKGTYYHFEPDSTSSYKERAQYNRKVVSYNKDETNGEYNVTFVYDYAKNHTKEQAYEIASEEQVAGATDKNNMYRKISIPTYEAIGIDESNMESNIELAEKSCKFILSSNSSVDVAKYSVYKAKMLNDLVGFYDKVQDAQGNEILDENGQCSYVFNPNQTGRYNVTFKQDVAGTYEMEELKNISLDDPSIVSLYYKQSTNAFEYYTYDGDRTHVVAFSPISGTEVSANKGYYYVSGSEKVEKGTGYYSGTYKYVKTTAPKGEYVLELDLDKYTGEVMTYDKGNGDYSWVEDNPDPFPETNYNATKIYMKDVLIKKSANFCYKGGLINSDRFKKTILGLSDEEASKFKIKVISITPEELNADYKKNGSDSIINHADMFFISDNYDQSAFFMWSWENFTEAGRALSDSERMTTTYNSNTEEGKQPAYKDWNLVKDKLTFKNNDLENATMNAIKNRVNSNVTIGDVTLPRAPLVYDVSLIDRAGSNNNVSKLYRSITSTESTQPRVYENVYAYAGSTNVLLDNQFTTSPNYSLGSYRNNFTNIIEDLQNEDIVRVANGLDPCGESLTPSNAIRYILNYESKRELIKKKSVTILEVQPSNSFTLKDRIKNDVTSWVRYFNLEPINSNANLNNYDNYNIKIVSMNSSEFIGKIEDLNSVYDMIYFGLDTRGMNVKNEQTVYNDSRMNGKIYCHVGDVVKCSTDLLGLLDDDFYKDYAGNKIGLKDSSYYWKKIGNTEPVIGNQRYSGNDITKVKYNDLINYVDGNYPVLFEDKFYGTYNGKVEPNHTYLDGVSYMYKFAEYCIGKSNIAESKIFTSKWAPTNEEEKVKASYFKTYLAIPKLEVKVSSKPTEYSRIDNGITTYLKPDSSGRYVLSYKFSITDKVALVASDLSYTVKLYIDVDADGRFSDEEEMKGLSVKKDNKKVEANELVLGKDSDSSTFTVTRELPEGYTGVVPWKLVVVRNSNDKKKNGYIRTSESGYTAIEKKSSEKEQVNILQINKASNSTLNLQYRLESSSKNDQDPNNYYYKYGNNLNDFKLNVTTMTTSEYIGKINEKENYLDGYNMVIIGFADCMTYLDSDKAVNKLVDFANEGKCILFTHDTTIFSNVKKYTPFYNIYNEKVNNLFPDVACDGDNNVQYRYLCGMDRFGITELVNSKDVDDIAQFFDINTMTSPVKIKETQGFTTQLLQRMALKTDYYRDKPTFNQYASPLNTSVNQLKNISNGASDWARTQTVHQINDGQITNYPYKIETDKLGNINTSITHSQYYQIDMGDDVVVWFTLAGDGTETPNLRYNVLPNDVRNNYYIYNKGNITYSGVGHEKKPTEMEAKLFINTMIAAYKAASEKPSINITNENIATNKDGEQFFYIDYDVKKGDTDDIYTNISGEEKDGRSYVDLYYRINNPNLDMNADLSVQYFVVDDKNKDIECTSSLLTTTKEAPDVPLSLNAGKIQVKASDPYETGDEQLDRLYCVKVPIDLFNNLASTSKNKKFKIKIYYVSNLKGKNVMENDTVVKFVNRSLFDLK